MTMIRTATLVASVAAASSIAVSIGFVLNGTPLQRDFAPLLAIAAAGLHLLRILSEARQAVASPLMARKGLLEGWQRQHGLEVTARGATDLSRRPTTEVAPQLSFWGKAARNFGEWYTAVGTTVRPAVLNRPNFVTAPYSVTTDVASMPVSVFAGATRPMGEKWRLRTRLDLEKDEAQTQKIALKPGRLSVTTENKEDDLSIRVESNIGPLPSIAKIEATKEYELNGKDGAEGARGRLSLNPRFNFEPQDDLMADPSAPPPKGGPIAALKRGVTDGFDAVLGYSSADNNTNAQVVVSGHGQQAGVSQMLNDRNRMTPSVAFRGGRMAAALAWERFGDHHTTTAVLRPDAVSAQWQNDKGWSSSMSVPYDGSGVKGPDVSYSKRVVLYPRSTNKGPTAGDLIYGEEAYTEGYRAAMKETQQKRKEEKRELELEKKRIQRQLKDKEYAKKRKDASKKANEVKQIAAGKPSKKRFP